MPIEDTDQAIGVVGLAGAEDAQRLANGVRMLDTELAGAVKRLDRRGDGVALILQRGLQNPDDFAEHDLVHVAR